MTMRRWDPFDDTLSLRDAISRLFEESIIPSRPTGSGAGRMAMPMDLRETEDQYVLEASLPGMKPEDIDITVHGNAITIQGETKADEEQTHERYHLRERRFGRFQRTLALPDNIKADEVNCSYEQGMLTLTLPKAEESRPRRISVGRGEQQLELDASPRSEQEDTQEREVG